MIQGNLVKLLQGNRVDNRLQKVDENISAPMHTLPEIDGKPLDPSDPSIIVLRESMQGENPRAKSDNKIWNRLR